MNYNCLLFDLDGTLVDSRWDLVNSVNLMLVDFGLEPIAGEGVLGFVGEGIELLIERSLAFALGNQPGSDHVREALHVYRSHYAVHLLDTTRTNPEVEATLNYFADLPKAVVTNKPVGLTRKLLEGLSLHGHFAAIIGGDSLSQRKPSAEPLLEAARLCGRPAARCLMVGDSRIDIEAGRAAGIDTCGYIPGFRGRGELEAAGANLLINCFSELRDLVGVAPGKR